MKYAHSAAISIIRISSAALAEIAAAVSAASSRLHNNPVRARWRGRAFASHAQAYRLLNKAVTDIASNNNAFSGLKLAR
ncbi:hypothetical protein SRABI106_02389 [Rahnella aquatilis]|jgi:hypothetical protein|nr:hypothetical protein SRABI106_02389 [Rahnella aquatilis]